ncbi:MAG TPA: type II toxin-antitoxin system VapB family antitoxin [Kineosporiaceae bacterium]|nr:type II toxin-antitoxin system VapB family antitoxin [Kineosporiaceae bacterium]
MTRITVEIDDELLAAAREVLGTETKVATINAALQEVARRKQVAEMLALLGTVEFDYTGSENSFRYGMGRDLSKLAEKARLEVEAERREAEGREPV